MAYKQRKRKVKKNVPEGVVHIHATFNNTVITVTDKEGNVISQDGIEIISPQNETNLFNAKEIRIRITDKNRKSIGSCKFALYPNLESVIIEDGVEEISACAFAGCPKLKSVVIPKTVKNISDGAFARCECLEEVQIEDKSKLENIGDYAFADCKKLESINLENASKMGVIFEEMRRRGYTDDAIEKIAGKNFLRVFSDVEKAAK